MEDVGTFVISRGHGPEVLEPVDRPLNFVPALIDRFIEACRSASSAAAALAVGSLVLRFRDGVLDVASSQVAVAFVHENRVLAQILGSRRGA